MVATVDHLRHYRIIDLETYGYRMDSREQLLFKGLVINAGFDWHEVFKVVIGDHSVWFWTWSSPRVLGGHKVHRLDINTL